MVFIHVIVHLMIFTGGFGGRASMRGECGEDVHRLTRDGRQPPDRVMGLAREEGTLGNLLEGSGSQGTCYRLGHARGYGLPLSGP